MAAMAGPSTQAAAACSTAAAITTGKIGHTASASALAPIMEMARPATSRSDRAASTSAPPGIWPARATRLPVVRTRPMSSWVHRSDVRYTATNGPNPVSTSAMKKTNPSRARWLRRDGSGDRACSSVPALIGGAEHDQRPAVLVFRRGAHLLAREVQRDPVVLAAGRREVQRVPVDRDLAVADAEEAAEVDHGRPHLPVAIHHDVDDPSHVLPGAAEHLPAEDSLDVLLIEHGCGDVAAGADSFRRRAGRRSPRPRRVVTGGGPCPAQENRRDGRRPNDATMAAHDPSR